MFGGFQTFPLYFKQSCMYRKVIHGFRNSRPKCTKQKVCFQTSASYRAGNFTTFSFSSDLPCDWLKISTNKNEDKPISLVNFSHAFPRETVHFSFPRLSPRETKLTSFRRPQLHQVICYILGYSAARRKSSPHTSLLK